MISTLTVPQSGQVSADSSTGRNSAIVVSSLRIVGELLHLCIGASTLASSRIFTPDGLIERKRPTIQSANAECNIIRREATRG